MRFEAINEFIKLNFENNYLLELNEISKKFLPNNRYLELIIFINKPGNGVGTVMKYRTIYGFDKKDNDEILRCQNMIIDIKDPFYIKIFRDYKLKMLSIL